ncbi:MAG: amino acid-binding protein, partial [Propionibacteriales bacterium]|nr:amino acid-binding protein [Propionibacteriales bacterium]
EAWSDLVVAGSPLSSDELVVVGRRGGPEFLESEIARLAHLIAMAASLRRNA